MIENRGGYKSLGNSNYKWFKTCMIDYKLTPIFPDWADFAKWWSFIGEGLLPTGLPRLVVFLKLIPSRIWASWRLSTLCGRWSIPRCWRAVCWHDFPNTFIQFVCLFVNSFVCPSLDAGVPCAGVISPLRFFCWRPTKKSCLRCWGAFLAWRSLAN